MRAGRWIALGGLVLAGELALSRSGDLLGDEPHDVAPSPMQRSKLAAAVDDLAPLPPPAPQSFATLQRAASLPASSSLEMHLPPLPAGGLDDPEAAVRDVLAQMSDGEVRAAITQLTRLRPSDLEGIRDVRDYAQRLAGIAMNGVLRSQAPESTPVSSVLFSPSLTELGAPAEMSARFEGGPDDRIYAVFPTEGYTSDQVLVKWFRDGEPEPLSFQLLGGPPRLLVFGRYPVRPGDPLNHVWLSRSERWEPGTYVVEFYDPAEPLAKLASGRFTISNGSAPPAPAPQTPDGGPDSGRAAAPSLPGVSSS